MKKSLNILIRLLPAVMIILFSGISTYPAGLLSLNKKETRLTVFPNQVDTRSWEAVLKGKVLSLGIREDASNNELLRVAQDKTRVVVRLYSPEGINKGDTLYIVNDKNLVVSKLKVESIFRSKTFGYMLIGNGIFSLTKIGNSVVQKAVDENSKYAFIYKARGDYFYATGQTGEAISQYKSALELDKNNPEAHLYLGMLYHEQNLLAFAMKEYELAYKEIGRIYDNEDKFLLLKGLVETRYFALIRFKLPGAERIKLKDEGIRFSKEALEMVPGSKEINFYLAMFYYLKPSPRDVEAKKQFLKVIELDPQKVEAFVNLAILYQKHKNSEKARLYAEMALKIDTSNKRARYILKIIKNQ